MGVRFSTMVVPPDRRRPQEAPHLVYDRARRGRIVAATNGAVFSEERAPSVPIGGVGIGSDHFVPASATSIGTPAMEARTGAGAWVSGVDATVRKFSVGFTPEIRPHSKRNGFFVDRMAFVRSVPGTGLNAGRMVPFYTASRAVRAYPYGFGCVGLLALGGAFVGDATAGGWEPGQSLHPELPLSRTALAWTGAGDVFLITCGGPGETQGPGPLAPGNGATWTDTVRFLQRTLPRLLHDRYAACLRGRPTPTIAAAVMLDGGPSTQLGYKRIDGRGRINLDRSAPHGNESAPSYEIPSLLVAEAASDVRRARRRHAARSGRRRR